jgi:hypothetical protein
MLRQHSTPTTSSAFSLIATVLTKSEVGGAVCADAAVAKMAKLIAANARFMCYSVHSDQWVIARHFGNDKAGQWTTALYPFCPLTLALFGRFTHS